MAILTELRDTTGLLTIDRREKANAYDRAHLDGLREGLDALAATARVIVICSAGDRAFCAGADLGELHAADPLDALDLRSQRVFNHLAALPVPTIAAVQGPAVAGGCELTLACDLRIVGPNARFSLPETALGLIPSAGGCTRLTRLIGPSRAKQVILAGASLDAETAVSCGLALKLASDPLAAALALALDLAKRDGVAMRLARQIIDAGEDRSSLDAERVSEALLYARKRGRSSAADR